MSSFLKLADFNNSFNDINDVQNYIIPSGSVFNSYQMMNNPYSDPGRDVSFDYSAIPYFDNFNNEFPNEMKFEKSKNERLINIITSEQMDSFNKGLIKIAEKIKLINYDAIIIPFRGAYPLFKQISAMCDIPIEKVIPIAFTGGQKQYLTLDPIIETIGLKNISLTILDTGIGGGGLDNLINTFDEYLKYNDGISIRLNVLYMYPIDREPTSLRKNGIKKKNYNVQIQKFPVEALIYEDFEPALGFQRTMEDKTIIYKTNENKGKLIILNKDGADIYEATRPHIFDQIVADDISNKLFNEENYHIFIDKKIELGSTSVAH